MASIGHLAVGLVAGRLHGGEAPAAWERRASIGTLLFFAALAELPDVDVVGVACGFHDCSLLGHRGISHSLVMAVALGLASGALARRLGWSVVRTAVAATLAVASHGMLDAFCEGGRGIPFLWPLTQARFHAPWRLLPDAPRGLKMLSRPGLLDLAVEFIIFFPLTAYALWRGRPALPRVHTAPSHAPSAAALGAQPLRR
jgi:inner membrane protein